MPTFRAALDRLALLSVTGVSHNYAINTIPDSLSRAQLPALLVLPGDIQDRRLFRERGEAFQAVAFSAGPRTATYTATHLLLAAPVSAAAGQRSHLPALVDLVDDYVAALAADVLLNNTLAEPAAVKIEPGVFTYADIAYHGCAFRHTWRIDV
jgi:hypothetical protein